MSDRLRQFPSELRRRGVHRVALAYAVAAWLLMQVADTVFPALHIPRWGITMVVVLCIAGFPLALVLAWLFEITPHGVQREEPNPYPAFEKGSGSAPSTQSGSTGSPGRRGGARPEGEAGVLPRHHTPLVGRERELAEIEALLASHARLITIIGPGGVGKTRLGIAAAEAAQERLRHGSRFVSLVNVDSGTALVPTIAENLRLRISSGEAAERQLINFLREKEMLLVLDNFEQLSESAALLSEILAAAPGVKLLVTSRERLNITPEVLYPLQGLARNHQSFSGPREGADAVRLFVQTARRSEPHFSPDARELLCITRICDAVAGVPLAIELAAVWAGTLSCEQIEQEIERDHDFLVASARDVPERHRSLRTVFESSWRLLPEEERRAYRRLSVFRGSFSRDAAEVVAQAPLPILSSLLGRSLLRSSGSGVFETLEVLRQYAWEKLCDDEPEREWTTRSFVRYYTGVLERAGEDLEGGQRTAALERLAAEMDNIRPAWNEAVAARDIDAVSRSLEVLFAFYDARGWVMEGEQVFDRAISALSPAAHPREPGSAEARVVARLRLRHGVFLFHLGKYQSAREGLTSAVAALRATGEDRDVALGLDALGHVAHSTGDYPEAQRLHEESLALYRRIGDRLASARPLVSLGNILYSKGDYDEAELLYSESLTISREFGDQAGSAVPLVNLGILASVRGSTDRADQLLKESLRIARRQNNQRLLATSLQNLGCNAYRAERLTEAEIYLNEGAEVCAEMGLRRLHAFCLNELAQVLSAGDRSEEARETRRRALAIANEIDESQLVLHILVNIARELHEERHESRRAAELLRLVVDHPATDQRARDAAAGLSDKLQQEAGEGLVPSSASGSDPAAALEEAVEEILAEAPILPASRSS